MTKRIWKAKSILYVFVTLALGWIIVGSVACNTVKGAGKDVEKGGEKLQNAADDAQH
jgi:predicted small secreted protein